MTTNHHLLNSAVRLLRLAFSLLAFRIVSFAFFLSLGLMQMNQAKAQTAPSITQQPQSQTNLIGSSVTISITVTGTSPFAYQWYKNGSVMGGFTNYDLRITNVALADAGYYACMVSNSYGSVTSAVATLTINGFLPPVNVSLIPAGTFTMGDTIGDGDTDGIPTHQVTLSAFFMDKYEVTKAQWDAVFTWATTNGYSFDNAGSGKATNHPVQTINWYDCVKWCNARSQKEGLMPAYYTDAELAVVCKTGQVAPYVNWNTGYRLPTEAEWEYAARGGLAGKRFPWGDTITHNQANYFSMTNYSYDISTTRGFHPDYLAGGTPVTSPVGAFVANGYGLYDMAGNVWEWCWDWYGSYGSGTQTDPRGSASGSSRLFRGGSWGGDAGICRTARRNGYSPDYGDNNNAGFRAVLPQPSTPTLAQINPTNQTVLVGSNVTFTVQAGGTVPLYYQWYKNGAGMGGFTNYDLRFTNLVLSDTGNYQCIVSNAYGIVTSLVANLFIAQPVSLSQQGSGTVSFYPTNYDIGSNVTLTATPARWYTFLRWSDGVTNNPRSVIIGPTNNYLAIFTNTVALEWVNNSWDRTYGGTGDDYLYSAVPASDGGYILGGSSFSGISGNKTSGNFGEYDWWVVKVDANGNKQWENNYGGIGDDDFWTPIIELRSGGGYFITGMSMSGASGNKTSGNFGGWDWWVMRLDGNGNKLWETNYGGTGTERIFCSQMTRDGGFILGGPSDSGASGNKTSGTFGGTDYWAMKLDANGIKQWETNYGGTGEDVLNAVQQTSDGGYILGGYSQSAVSGNKTSGNFGNWDYWVLKIDANGVKQWETNYGGADVDVPGRIVLSSDGGYLVSGYSSSGTSGNKTSGNFGLVDGWLVKLDINGVKQWETNYGGTGNDYLGDIQQTSVGGYLVGGTSNSGVSGNKTTESFGDYDYWVMKLDANGAKQWETNYGGTGGDQLPSMKQSRDGTLILGGYSASGATGNKTSGSFGLNDGWVVKWFSPVELPVGTPVVYVAGSFANGVTNTFTEINSARVSMQSSFTNGVMFYTLDGTAPSLNSIPYTNTFTLANTNTYSRTFTLRAIAYSSDRSQSCEAEPVTVQFIARPIQISQQGAGTVTLNPQQPSYALNQPVTLTATPSRWYTFNYWISNGVQVTGSTNLLVTVGANNNYTAIFTNTVPLETLAVTKQWEANFGGTSGDLLYSAALTSDGGYILGGQSSSGASGNKTSGNFGGVDGWVVKVDANGVKQWETNYGGVAGDVFSTVAPTADGGYILGGHSSSGVSGNKTSAGFGDWDYWVVKVDANGAKQWESSFGGGGMTHWGELS